MLHSVGVQLVDDGVAASSGYSHRFTGTVTMNAIAR
jgi:hypothetical protein